ncbi:MAG: hypothetical protein ABR577_05855 [Pyrinomonadaceae bacterium]
MNGKSRDAAQRWLAIIVIITMLITMKIPMSVLIFFAIVTYVIWRAVQRSDHDETTRIFKFYVAANDILRDEDKRWYGYEIEKVIERGERAFNSMTDPPPLVSYALGALYHRAGNYRGASEHLLEVVENADFDERQRFAPSPELRRYVHLLRKLEREPSEAPQTMAAVRSLERARRNRAAALLAESRARLNLAPPTQTSSRLSPFPAEQSTLFPDSTKTAPPAPDASSAWPQNTPPPPIAEILRDVHEEKKTA